MSSKVSPEASLGGPPNVLIVDDSADFREALAEALEARAYLAVEASSGDEALSLVELIRFDVILMDERMPGSRGSEVLRELRARGHALPVVMMTAGGSARAVAESAQTPFWVDKPADIDTVERVLEVALRGGSATTPEAELAEIVRLLERESGQPVGDAVEATRRLIEAKRRAEAELRDEEGERTSLTSLTLASMVAHELRSPLAALQLQIDRLSRLDAGLGERQLGVVERCRAIILQTEKLIEGAMTYASIEAGATQVSSRVVDLRALVEEVVAVRRRGAERIGVSFRIEPSGPVEGYSDPRILRVAVANLVDNAVKFSRGGAVTLSLSRQENQARVAVRDSGPGIDEASRARVFRAFQRLEELAEGPIEGFGLGLALVPRVISALGGRLELESEVGVGSCFTIVLPADPDPVAAVTSW